MPLVSGCNAAKGSRQTGRVTWEDAMAPEADQRVDAPEGLGSARSWSVPTDPAERTQPTGVAARLRATPVWPEQLTWNCDYAGESNCLIET